MKFLQKMSRKKAFFIIALPVGIGISILGGGKLLIYLALLVTGFIVGRSYASLKRAYDDYKLGLRVNSILYSQKQTEEIVKERDELRSQLAVMNERLKLYKAQAHSVSLPKLFLGDDLDDNQHCNGATRLREDL